MVVQSPINPSLKNDMTVQIVKAAQKTAAMTHARLFMTPPFFKAVTAMTRTGKSTMSGESVRSVMLVSFVF